MNAERKKLLLPVHVPRSEATIAGAVRFLVLFGADNEDRFKSSLTCRFGKVSSQGGERPELVTPITKIASILDLAASKLRAMGSGVYQIYAIAHGFRPQGSAVEAGVVRRSSSRHAHKIVGDCRRPNAPEVSWKTILAMAGRFCGNPEETGSPPVSDSLC